MKYKMQNVIGEIINVSGNILTIEMLDSLKSNMSIINGVVYKIGQIGSFVKIPLGFSVLFGIVNQIGAGAIPEAIKESYDDDYGNMLNKQWINVVLVGEQIGTKFRRGISHSPTTGDKAHLVTLKDLEIIYGGYDDTNSVEVGNISVSESLVAKLDIDKLVSRHSAIIGSTGSGKSNTVGVLLKAIADKKFKSSRILVIDPHGEYSSTLKEISNVYKIKDQINKGSSEKELYIPYWALPFKVLLDVFSGNLSDSNKEYIREKIVEKKKESAKINNIEIEEELINIDTPIPYSIKQLWFELDDFERRTLEEVRTPEKITERETTGNAENLISNKYPAPSIGNSAPFLNFQAKGILSFLDSMRLKLKDSTYSFLFDPGEYSPSINGKVEKDLNFLLYEWLGSKKSITILDLSGIPSHVMISISGTLLKIIYDTLFWGQNLDIGGKKQPLLIVLEEAHNYLKAGEKSISSNIIQTIAKEGRKYGVGLSLVTQRPSEIDETVLSQCGTMITLRMNNSKDRSHISASLQDELSTIMSLLPNLRTGEGIISGEAVKIPSRVQFYKLINAPRSEDPKVSKEWNKKIESTDEKYKELLMHWRNKKIGGRKDEKY
ncbi:ATP-binding protein [Oceanotoga teriensis]|uniref:ATP-binding protein n=1 Tax=Oceanotoga teriensis TaxID=515440 RepID=UPI0027138D9C|nr:ATP-binding protein [Oceanotoga teriensis]MDO7977729.1 ATP-binding protein [Oceanotoga teriensis]